MSHPSPAPHPCSPYHLSSPALFRSTTTHTQKLTVINNFSETLNVTDCLEDGRRTLAKAKDGLLEEDYNYDQVRLQTSAPAPDEGTYLIRGYCATLHASQVSMSCSQSKQFKRRYMKLKVAKPNCTETKNPFKPPLKPPLANRHKSFLVVGAEWCTAWLCCLPRGTPLPHTMPCRQILTMCPNYGLVLLDLVVGYAGPLGDGALHGTSTTTAKGGDAYTRMTRAFPFPSQGALRWKGDMGQGPSGARYECVTCNGVKMFRGCRVKDCTWAPPMLCAVCCVLCCVVLCVVVCCVLCCALCVVCCVLCVVCCVVL